MSSLFSILIFQVLNFFTARVESLDKSVSVQEVVEVIKQGAVQFRRDRLKVVGVNIQRFG